MKWNTKLNAIILNGVPSNYDLVLIPQIFNLEFFYLKMYQMDVGFRDKSVITPYKVDIVHLI